MHVVESFRLRREHRGFGDRVFRIASGETLVGHTENFVADLQFFYAGADRINHTG